MLDLKELNWGPARSLVGKFPMSLRVPSKERVNLPRSSAHRAANASRSKAKPVMLFLRLDGECGANAFRCEHASSGFDQFVEVVFRQIESFVFDGLNPESAFQ